MTLGELVRVVDDERGVVILFLPEYDEYVLDSIEDINPIDYNRKVTKISIYKGRLYIDVKK